MKLPINIILQPGKAILTLYGLGSLFFLTAYVWNFSFVWEFLFSVTHFIAGLMGAIIADFWQGLRKVMIYYDNDWFKSNVSKTLYKG